MMKSDLYEALELLNREEMDALSEMEANAPEHEFSEEFEEKMERLLRRWKRKFIKRSDYRLRKSWLVAAIVALILSISMSVEASREAIIRFVIEMYEKYSNVRHEGSGVDFAPDKILEYREPDWGEEYVEVERSENGYFYKTVRENVFAGHKIAFIQCVIDYNEVGINTEYAKLIEGIIDSEITVYSTTYGGYTTLFWNDGQYDYEISGNIKKEELLSLIDSMYLN